MKSVQPPERQTYSWYAGEVKLTWSRAVAGILQMGYLLARARIDLTPVEWRQLISEECPFDLTVACRLIRIAEDQRITEPGIQAELPPSWNKVYELVTLPEPVFRQALEEGTIRPAITGKEIAELRSRPGPSSPPRPEPVDRIERLEKALTGVLVSFPFVESVRAEISDPKSQVVEVSRRKLQEAA